MPFAEHPPDTTVRPWHRTLWIIVIGQFVTGIGFSSFFPFLTLYVIDLGSVGGFNTEFLAGMAFAGQAFSMMIASPIWGSLADRYGRKLMVARAMFGGTVVIALMGLVRNAEELILLRTLQGAITGTVAANNALAAATAPRERVGYAMGLLQMALALGISFGPLIGGFISDLLGYRAVFFVTSGLLFGSGLLVWFGVDEQFSPRIVTGGIWRGLWRRWRSIVIRPGVAVAYSLRFTSELGRMMLLPVMPLFVQVLLESLDRINTFTGVVIGLGSLFTTVTALVLGRLGDRIGHRRILIISLAVSALTYFAQMLVSTGWQLLILQALSGAALGGVIPSIGALLARYSEQGDEGAVYGLDNSVNSGSRTLAPLMGVGVAYGFGLRATFGVCGLIFAITMLIALRGLPRNR